MFRFANYKDVNLWNIMGDFNLHGITTPGTLGKDLCFCALQKGTISAATSKRIGLLYTATALQAPPLSINLQAQPRPAAANQPQIVAPLNQQQQLLQTLQSPSSLDKMLSQQTQALQASFQSSQHAISQIQQQLQMMQPSESKYGNAAEYPGHTSTCKKKLTSACSFEDNIIEMLVYRCGTTAAATIKKQPLRN